MITGDEPANPTIESINHNGVIQLQTPHDGIGLTIRQQFAMAAMQGLLCNDGNHKTLAEEAARCADALIEELNKKVLTEDKGK